MPALEAIRTPPLDSAAFVPRVVVVDDDRYIVSLLQDLFVQEGHDVRGFTSSPEAQAHLAAEPADIVIADIKMPEISGLDLLREIRQRSPGTLVIIITGYSTLQTTLEAVTLGAFDYITKPFVLDEVRLVVQRAVEQLRLRRENRRLSERLAQMESEFQRLRSNFERLTAEFEQLGDALRTQAGPVTPLPFQVPAVPLEALRPYAEAARTRRSRYSATLEILEDLHRRGALSDADFAGAKRRLAEATGQG